MTDREIHDIGNTVSTRLETTISIEIDTFICSENKISINCKNFPISCLSGEIKMAWY